MWPSLAPSRLSSSLYDDDMSNQPAYWQSISSQKPKLVCDFIPPLDVFQIVRNTTTMTAWISGSTRIAPPLSGCKVMWPENMTFHVIHGSTWAFLTPDLLFLVLWRKYVFNPVRNVFLSLIIIIIIIILLLCLSCYYFYYYELNYFYSI